MQTLFSPQFSLLLPRPYFLAAIGELFCSPTFLKALYPGMNVIFPPLSCFTQVICYRGKKKATTVVLQDDIILHLLRCP